MTEVRSLYGHLNHFSSRLRRVVQEIYQTEGAKYTVDVRHLVSIEDVTPEWFIELYGICRDMIKHPDRYVDACHAKVMASLFFEPSTRTNFSFQSAMMRLGGSVFGFSDPSATSASKGESLADTIRMVSAYADTVVMRSPLEGAAYAGSLYSEVPLINAGDGGHMHPTQTLTDLTTICEKRGHVGDLNVGLCGDLKNGRTVHSLALALAKFPNIRFTFIAPREMAMPGYVQSVLRGQGMRVSEVTNLESTLPQLDVLYMTRIQKERFTDPLEYERNKGLYVLTRRKLDRAKQDLLIMHPLPRVDEISPDVDDDPRAVYFEQARYGMFIRQALLFRLVHMPRVPCPPAHDPTPRICQNNRCVTAGEGYLPNLTKGQNGETICAYCDKQIHLKSPVTT